MLCKAALIMLRSSCCSLKKNGCTWTWPPSKIRPSRTSSRSTRTRKLSRHLLDSRRAWEENKAASTQASRTDSSSNLPRPCPGTSSSSNLPRPCPGTSSQHTGQQNRQHSSQRDRCHTNKGVASSTVACVSIPSSPCGYQSARRGMFACVLEQGPMCYCSCTGVSFVARGGGVLVCVAVGYVRGRSGRSAL